MYFSTNNNLLYFLLFILVITNLFTGRFDLLDILLTFPGVLIALTFHEFAHAYVADKLGDDTPRAQGRLNLNPLSHMDPFGFVLLLFAHVGWGKPVKINPLNFNRKYSLSAAEAIVAAAGPIMNFILAIVFSLVYFAIAKFIPGILFALEGTLNIIINYIIIVNIGLGVFNLIPLPPLDGSKILMHFLPYNAKRWFNEHTHIFYIVFLIIWITPIAGYIISPIINSILNGIFNLCNLIFQVL